MNLLAFGLGYSVQRFIVLYANRFEKIAGTVRSPGKARAIANATPDVEPVLFDDRDAVRARLADADALLVSIAPGDDDPALAAYGEAIAAAPNVKRIVYLSTIGVYGDHGGAWIDEDAELLPASKRNRARVEAEKRWLGLANGERGVFVLRLAGIYGPGRNQIENLREGTARRIVKEGQVFNRIHVDDIAHTVAACLDTRMPGGIINVTDDEPAPPQDVVTYAAGLLGVEPPPETPFAEADFTPMGLSFWGQNKRVANRVLREELGVALAYPTYREGLRGLLVPV